MPASQLLKASLRQQAVYVPETFAEPAANAGSTEELAANLAKLGYGLSEPLLRALRRAPAAYQQQVLVTFRAVMGLGKNWTPLVRGWQVPTGEGWVDHLLGWLANVFPSQGTRLPCGHVIPPNTFPLERYTGCPLCGTPFELHALELHGQGSKLKVLDLYREADLHRLLHDLLTAKTALDATQVDTLQLLLPALPPAALPAIAMKETRMVVMATLADAQPERVLPLLSSPTDVLRFLWYEHTGQLQLVEPRTLRQRLARNQQHVFRPLDNSTKAAQQAKADLKLRYGRRRAAVVAGWLNALPQSPRQMAEHMHPKRGMWVRFIRALRLAEYARRPGHDKLRELLDVFYRQDYPVWQGRVEHVRLRLDQAETLRLLRQRPGLFARSLFANMLWFGPDEVLAAFREVIDQVPARLVFSLAMFAEGYFDPQQPRAVKPLGGVRKTIPANPLLQNYAEEQRAAMRAAVTDLCREAVRRRFAAQPTSSRSIYIAPALFTMPVPIGDRSDNVQDLPAALMGTRFPVEGDTVRLFMQWGVGLPAQHMDMDLSARITYPDRLDFCAYNNLSPTGCRHSGDMRAIPHEVGTAEYIDLDVPVLLRAGARYVSFTCNAYSTGALTPNLTVGWMDSRHPMRVSETTGVAYDPACVQYQVRITNGLAKGLVFGVLDVAQREIIWAELPFEGQVVGSLSVQDVEALLRRLRGKLSLGDLLLAKAEAQQLTWVETPAEADEAYTAAWARNAAAVTQLLVD